MQLNTLGPLRLADGTLTRPKPLLLLAYLALEGPKPRRFVAELFFHDARDPADALSTTLRRLLGEGDDVVQTVDGFVSTRLRCDAQRVLDLLDAGQVDEAVSLHDAPFLSALRLPLPPELEEWVFSTREHVAGRLRSAALTAAEAALDEAGREAAAHYASIAVTVEGAPELQPPELRRLHGVLLVTHPHHAARLREDAKQFGLVLDRTRSAYPISPVWPRHQPISPALLSPLVGRDVELLAIARALTEGDCRLLCLHGPGGVGKTRLAMQAAYEQHQNDAFRDHIAVVALEALTLATQVPHAIAAALSLPSLAEADPWGDLAAGLGPRQLLLVLDNFEHVQAAAPRLPHLLAACPGLVLLVTSRERLNLASEWVLTLDGLPIPERTMSLERALLCDALDLFVQRAKRTSLSFTVRAAHLTHAITICRAVDGFPLGLELAASWVTTMPLADIADTLTRNPIELDATLRDMAPRHSSMNAVMEHSWSLLGRDDRDVLQRLAVFHGGFRRQAASTVAGASITNLRRLVDKSLLRMTPNGRFERHALLHQFTRQKLAEHPEAEALARERHCTYYIGLLQDASARAGAADFDEVFALLEEEEGNILACLDWAVAEKRTDALLALADPLLWYFPMRGRFHEGASIFARAIAGLNEDDPAVQEAIAALSLGQGFLARFAGDLEEAWLLSARAERMARASGSRLQLIRSLDVLGQAVLFAGRYDEARAYLSESVQRAREHDDVTLLYRGLGYLLLGHTFAGDYEAADACAREATVLHDGGTIAKGFDTIAMLLAIGVMESSREAWDEARVPLERADAMLEEVAYQGSTTVIKASLANVLFELGCRNDDPTLFDRAEHHTHAGLVVAEAGNESMGHSLLLGMRSRLALRDGCVAEARRLAVAAIEVAWQNNNPTVTFWAIPRLIDAYLAMDEALEAAILLRMVATSTAAPAWVKTHGHRTQRALARGRSSPQLASIWDAAGCWTVEAAMDRLLSARTSAPWKEA